MQEDFEWREEDTGGKQAGGEIIDLKHLIYMLSPFSVHSALFSYSDLSSYIVSMDTRKPIGYEGAYAEIS